MTSALFTSGAATSRWGQRLASIGLVLAVLCVIAAVLSGVGYRLGWWHFRTGFSVLGVAFWGALAAVVVSVIGLVMGRAARPRLLLVGLLGALIGAVTAYIPWSYRHLASSLPYIHDISTDTHDPPELIAAAKLRKADDHPVAYDGAEVAAQQQKAYPDLAPLVTDVPKDQVFEAARSTLSDMGLEITAADPTVGRLEAVATSLLYGFKDDVAVRIRDTPAGTRVDVRSKSRVGRSDLGINAKRIRTFLSKLHAALPH
jgi:uncharacterized protein (DUF1499 family)